MSNKKNIKDNSEAVGTPNKRRPFHIRLLSIAGYIVCIHSGVVGMHISVNKRTGRVLAKEVFRFPKRKPRATKGGLNEDTK